MTRLEDLQSQKRGWQNFKSDINSLIIYLSRSSETLSKVPSISPNFQIDDDNKDKKLKDGIDSIVNAKNYFSTVILTEIDKKIKSINNAIVEEEARIAAEKAAAGI